MMRRRRALLDVIVGHTPILAPLCVLRGLGVGWIRVEVDYVPGVQEAGKDTETAKGEVNEGVCAAEASLDPD